MSNTLTSAQIATFDEFFAAVEGYLKGISDGISASRYVKDQKAFGLLWDAISRPSKLAPVMNNTTALAERGRTKGQFQLRTPEPESNLCFRPNGSPVMSRRHCVMFTAEAYREARKEITGLKLPETFYYVRWDSAPAWLQAELSSKFPKKSEDKPVFTPSQIGVLLRKGRKPSKKSEKRHTWAGFDFLVTGTYGEDNVVIAQAFVANKPYVAKLAEVVGIDCPDWGQNDATPQEQEEIQPLAASGLMNAAKAIL